MFNLFLTALILLSPVHDLSAQKSHCEIWLFTADADNASFIAQKAALNDFAGLKERDILIHEVIGFKAHQALFKKYKASPHNFTFILVGKDGGEKLRASGPVSQEKLYRTIDAMPMRKLEMKQ